MNDNLLLSTIYIMYLNIFIVIILFRFDLCFLEIRTFHLKRTMVNLLILTNRKNNELQSNAIHKQGLWRSQLLLVHNFDNEARNWQFVLCYKGLCFILTHNWFFSLLIPHILGIHFIAFVLTIQLHGRTSSNKMMNLYLRHIQQLSVAHFYLHLFSVAPVQFPTVFTKIKRGSNIEWMNRCLLFKGMINALKAFKRIIYKFVMIQWCQFSIYV